MGGLLESGWGKSTREFTRERCSQYETAHLRPGSKSERSLAELKHRAPFLRCACVQRSASGRRQSADSMRLPTGSSLRLPTYILILVFLLSAGPSPALPMACGPSRGATEKRSGTATIAIAALLAEGTWTIGCGAQVVAVGATSGA